MNKEKSIHKGINNKFAIIPLSKGIIPYTCSVIKVFFNVNSLNTL